MPEVAVVMPKMSMTMTDGEVLSWNKKAGDTVGVGDVVCEVLTDKVDMEVESPVAGTLVRVVASVGDQIAVGDPLAFIDSAASGLLDGVFGPADTQAESGADATAHVNAAAATPASAAPAVTTPAVTAPDAAAADDANCATTPPSRKARIPALPGARRRAGELGIDVASLTGTGPGGAVRIADVERAAAAAKAPGPLPASPQPTSVAPTADRSKPAHTIGSTTAASAPTGSTTAPGSTGEGEADPGFADALKARKSALRKAIARAMDVSATTPQFTVWAELDLADADTRRDRISWTTVLLAAFARALADHPLGGPAPDGGVAVALAVDTPVGLLGPVIRGADTRSLRELDEDVRGMARRARAGQLTSDDLAGATTTFSNLGGWGIDDFNALLTPGQASALSAGAVTPRPVVRHGGLAVALTCRVGLTVDHRHADGADAARILEQMKSSLGRTASEFFGERSKVGSR